MKELQDLIEAVRFAQRIGAEFQEPVSRAARALIAALEGAEVRALEVNTIIGSVLPRDTIIIIPKQTTEDDLSPTRK